MGVDDPDQRGKRGVVLVQVPAFLQCCDFLHFAKYFEHGNYRVWSKKLNMFVGLI